MTEKKKKEAVKGYIDDVCVFCVQHFQSLNHLLMQFVSQSLVVILLLKPWHLKALCCLILCVAFGHTMLAFY